MKQLQSGTDWIKACVYGPSGTGKSSLGVTAPSPLILLSEEQGALHIRQAANRLGVPVPPVLVMERMDDYRAVLKAFSGDRNADFVVEMDGVEIYRGPWPETLVIDSLTDACRLIVDDIRKQSPQKAGKDGLPVDAQRFWNVLQDRAQNLIRHFRRVPAHVLFLCLAKDSTIGPDDAPVRSVTPDLPMNKLAGFLTAATNLVGYSYRARSAKGQTGFGVLFSGPEAFLLKGCDPLRAKEPQNFARWVAAIHAQVASTDAVVGTQEFVEVKEDEKKEEEENAAV